MREGIKEEINQRYHLRGSLANHRPQRFTSLWWGFCCCDKPNAPKKKTDQEASIQDRHLLFQVSCPHTGIRIPVCAQAELPSADDVTLFIFMVYFPNMTLNSRWMHMHVLCVPGRGSNHVAVGEPQQIVWGNDGRWGDDQRWIRTVHKCTFQQI